MDRTYLSSSELVTRALPGIFITQYYHQYLLEATSEFIEGQRIHLEVLPHLAER